MSHKIIQHVHRQSDDARSLDGTEGVQDAGCGAIRRVATFAHSKLARYAQTCINCFRDGPAVRYQTRGCGSVGLGITCGNRLFVPFGFPPKSGVYEVGGTSAVREKI